MKNKQRKPGRLKSAVQRWLGLTYDQWANQFGATSDTGITVSADKMLTLSTLWACVRLIAQTISTLPLNLYEELPDGSRKKVTDDLSLLLRKKPNADMTAVLFWETLVANAMLTGNGFARKLYIGQRLVSLEPLVTDRLTWGKKQEGGYWYRYINDSGTPEEIPEEEIYHLPGFTISGKFGLSVIKYGVQVFGSALASEQAANKTFKNGLMPVTGFKFDKILKPEQRTDFRKNMESITGAMNAGKSPLLEGGMEPVQIGINPKDAQLLESRNFSAEEICRWCGVPGRMVGVKDEASSWASSSEQINIWFLQYGLRPWLKRIEESIWAQLMTPAQRNRMYAEYSVEGLLRADTQARAQFYSTALQNGWMNRTTVARLENLPNIPGGDIYTVQSNLIPLDKLGEAGEGETVKAALRHWLREESDET
ncbi:phage portal protein [Methylophaga sp. OBS4]|uniref:phage portal protein n=1 Tax=Methylophaga sp. OBS4 TaxID=2991935 RepID=UPI00224E03D0|nr:phage portal protein [Methylophaga sp. OBS4]MCX4186761.1 phage portal protein [Methylophaga sp. OBS4]